MKKEKYGTFNHHRVFLAVKISCPPPGACTTFDAAIDYNTTYQSYLLYSSICCINQKERSRTNYGYFFYSLSIKYSNEKCYEYVVQPRESTIACMRLPASGTRSVVASKVDAAPPPTPRYLRSNFSSSVGYSGAIATQRLDKFLRGILQSHPRTFVCAEPTNNSITMTGENQAHLLVWWVLSRKRLLGTH